VPLDSNLAARLLHLAGELGAPQLLRAVLTSTGTVDGVMCSLSGRGHGTATGAIQPPALICGIQDSDVLEGPAVSEALRDALQMLGWSALEGWEGWGRFGNSTYLEVGASSWDRWSVWIVAAAQGLPSYNSERLGQAASAAPTAEEKPSRCDVVKAYCSFAALADACLDLTGPSAGGARDCADFAWRLLPLLRQAGMGCGFFERTAVQGRLLAAVANLGDVDLAMEVLSIMAGDSTEEVVDAGVSDWVGVIGTISTAEVPLELDHYLIDAIIKTVKQFGWASVGSGVLAVLEVNRHKVCGVRY
jgi:hypothetical protein